MAHSTATKVLIVDNDAEAIEAIQAMIEPRFATLGATSGAQALDLLQRDAAARIILTDLRMPEMNGLELLREIKTRYGSSRQVLVFTAFGSAENVTQALRLGAWNYMRKPLHFRELAWAIESMTAQPDRAHDGSRGDAVADVIGATPAMQSLRDMIAKTAAADHPILLRGEIGVGKKHLARALHHAGLRSGKPFVVVNCSSVLEDSMHAVLFGGSRARGQEPFAGALNDARGGTLVLEEINDMLLGAQQRLLGHLQSLRFGTADLAREQACRVIATTTQPLRALVQSGAVSEELYYYLSPVTFEIPPLRSRAEDIPLLINHRLRQHARKLDLVRFHVADEVWPLLLHAWPRNVLELFNGLDRALALSDRKTLTAEDFALAGVVRAAPGVHGQAISLEQMERDHIQSVYQMVERNKSKTAQILGINRETLYRKLRKYKIH